MPTQSRFKEALSALNGPLIKFLSVPQRQVLRMNLLSEEGEHFAETILNMVDVIDQMPTTYQTDMDSEPDKLVKLHYFIGGRDFYILEKEVSGGVDQAFGLTYVDGEFEYGYISITEITSTGAELDLNWDENSNVEQVKMRARPGPKTSTNHY